MFRDDEGGSERDIDDETDRFFDEAAEKVRLLEVEVVVITCSDTQCTVDMRAQSAAACAVGQTGAEGGPELVVTSPPQPKAKDVWPKIESLSGVSEWAYTFEEYERQSGEVRVVEGSYAHKFWGLVAFRSPEVEDPLRKVQPTLQTVERDAAYEYDLSMEMLCKFFEMEDAMDAYDEDPPAPEKAVDRSLLMERSGHYFDECRTFFAMASRGEAVWERMRDDRVRRIDEALALEDDRAVEAAWTPAGTFRDECAAEAASLRGRGLDKSKWFNVQLLFTKLTGRPTFSLKEVDKLCRPLGPDPDHRPGVDASLVQRVRLANVAYSWSYPDRDDEGDVAIEAF